MKSILMSMVLLFSAVFAGYILAAEPQYVDFGDAPDPGYPTLLQSNGARHKDTSRVWLGDAVDVEANARVTDADQGDDGLVSTNPLAVRVTAAPLPAVARVWYQRIVDVLLGRGRNRPYFVNVLIDRDNNTSWQSSSEWVVRNQRVQVPAGSSAEVLLKDVSGNDVRWDRASEGWMRVTLTDARIRGYNGTTRNPFQIGETEDYAPLIEPTKEPRRAIWCFVDEKACRTLTSEESAEARDNKVELKGPYPDNASCVADCSKKTIETPTPDGGFPKRPPEQPKERTIPTVSPATASCFGNNTFIHPFDGAINCSVYNKGALEYRCCDSGPVGQPIYACHGASPFEWENWPADSATRCYGTPSAPAAVMKNQ